MSESASAAANAVGLKLYDVVIEGVEHDWDRPTITPFEICTLAGWSTETEVLEVNLETNHERPLHEGEKVQLEGRHHFGRKIAFKRG